METWQKVGACALVLLASLGAVASRHYKNESETKTRIIETVNAALSERTLQVTELERRIKIATATKKHTITQADGSKEEWEDVTTEFEQNESMINSLSVELDSQIDKRIQLEAQVRTLESSKPSFRHWGVTLGYDLSQTYTGGLGYHMDLVLLDAGVYGTYNSRGVVGGAVGVRF